jgi:hypothetical protein
MADWDDVDRVAGALPGVERSTSYGRPSWSVGGKGFVWDRPLSRKDRADLGDAAPDGPLLGVRVDGLDEKEAVLATPGPWFTIPHFDGYPAVLVRLDDATPEQLAELVLDAWRATAPARLLAEHERDQPG